MFQEIYDERTGHIIIRPKSASQKIKYALVRGDLLSGICSKIKALFCRGWKEIDLRLGDLGRYFLFKKAPITDNRVVFFTFQGKYTCNSKYIAEKLLELHPEYEVIFVVNEEVENKEVLDVPDGVKFVLKDSTEAYYALATAHYWVDNALCCVWRNVPKRKGQIYINTWHGSLGIKRLSGNKHWKNRAKVADKETDYFLTNSVFDEHVFSESFWPHVAHLKVGHPRNDIFFDEAKMKEVKDKVYSYYDIKAGVKTVLYAPTFRDNKKNVSAIVLDYESLKSTLEEKFGGEWKVLVRPHFHNVAAFKLDDETDDIVNASDYDDMQELMAAMDVGITDYSSWIFDYIFTGKPAFIYARDIEEYVNSRGFYYSLNDTPFSIASDDNSLRTNILNFDEIQYEADVKKFLAEKGCYEKGTASEAVVEFMVSHHV